MIVLCGLPALLTFLIRVFVPESEKWEHERRQGKTSHWQSYDLLGVMIGCLGPFLIVYVWASDQTGGITHSTALRVTATLAGLVIATVGYTFPVLRYLQRLHAAGGEAAASRSPKLILGRMMLAAGGTLRITDQDVDPHKLIQVAGPRVMLGKAMMTGDVAQISFPAKGVYKFATKTHVAGMNEMPGTEEVATIGPDNKLMLTVSVA